MKKPIIASLLILFGLHAHAQYLDIRGMTIEANAIVYYETDEPESFPIDQVFMISFADGIFVHLVYSGGTVDQSQVYKIENDRTFMDEGMAVYQFDAVSGLSGLTYYYEVKIDSNGRLSYLKLTQPDQQEHSYFEGGITALKTFIQEDKQELREY